MPTNSGRSWIRRGLSEFVDRAFLGNRAHDFGSGFWNKQGAIQGGIAGVVGAVNPLLGLAANKGFDAYNRNQSQAITRDQFAPDTSLDMSGWGNPQVSIGAPQTASIGGYAPSAPNVPTMQPVEAQAPWQSLGTSTGNVFSGGMLGSWANGGAAPRGIQYGNGSGAGTGYGGSSYANDAWGQTAAGFGVGAGNSGFGNRQSGTDGRGFKVRT
jgi:hypothetical protein